MKHADLYIQVPAANLASTYDFSSKIGMLGSCFSQSMYRKFRRFGLDAWSSPMGTIYNPLSIFKELDYLMDFELPWSIHENRGVFFAWETAHSLSSLDKQELEEALLKLRIKYHHLLTQTNVLFITVGSAWAYFLQPENFLVANCHKVPGNQFQKRLLSLEEMSQGFKEMHERLLVVNPGLEIVLTVSPVRHIREGLIQNNRSKARLIEWTHSMVEQYSNVHYFPSYEIMVDELRDYRFFEPDGVHPSSQAIHFVWDRLVEVLISKEAQAVFHSIEEVRKLEEHRWSNEKDRTASKELIAAKKKALEAFPIAW
ncbi:MAG: hypothetical protein RL432_2287 [Bacteroidota bacterium]|jgi:hypothetical protein